MIVQLNDSDLTEIFALFSSPTKDEVAMIYSEDSNLFFEKEDLSEEYELHEARREFAIDAWRAAILFLHSHGYVLSKNGEAIDLLSSSGLED